LIIGYFDLNNFDRTPQAGLSAMEKFILTKELGRLARWLRILGFDTLYCRDDNLGVLIIQALRDDRVIITRRRNTRHLQKRTIVVNSERLSQQLREVQRKLNLDIKTDKMFTRCTVCNEILREVRKEELKEDVPEYVYVYQDSFMRCPGCGKIYWQGSHWGNIKETIAKVVNCRN
jgi:uncharacterized protein with PIN domain